MTDEDPDTRYQSPMNNVTKVRAICHATGIAKEEFDLTRDYPLGAWSETDDEGILICGSFLTDMQEVFYKLVIDNKPGHAQHEVWEAHATAEYWNRVFENILHRRKGILLRDPRRLH